MSSYQGYRCGGLHRRYSSVPIQTIIPIDQVQLRSTSAPYRVCTSYCRYNPLYKDKQTPARSRQRGTFAGRDRNMLPIYISRLVIYIHTKEGTLRIK